MLVHQNSGKHGFQLLLLVGIKHPGEINDTLVEHCVVNETIILILVEVVSACLLKNSEEQLDAVLVCNHVSLNCKLNKMVNIHEALL